MVAKVTLSESTISLLKLTASIVKDEDGSEYYFLPFWFKKIGDTNEYEMNSLEKLPKKLQDLIISKRNNGCQEK